MTEETLPRDEPNTPAPVEKIKNQKRVEAGRKGAEAKKSKALLRKKEEEEKQITLQNKIEEREEKEPKIENKYYEYLPLIASIVVVGFGFYFIKETPKETVIEKPEIIKNQKIDPFEFN